MNLNTESSNKRRWQQLQPGLTKGNKIRIFTSYNYEDRSAIEPTKDDLDWWKRQLSLPPEKLRFQVKLYLALEQSRVDGFDDAISWMPHGRAFKIND